MIRVSLRGMLSRKLRAALTATAVLLGVAMISGTLIYSDAINGSFDDIFKDATKGADVVISGKAARSQRSQPPPIPEKVASEVAALPGVRNVASQISDIAAVVGKNGKLIESGNSPTFMLSYMPPPFDSLKVTEGKAPSDKRIGTTKVPCPPVAPAKAENLSPQELKQLQASGRAPQPTADPDRECTKPLYEVALDQKTIKDQGFKLGQHVKIATDEAARPFKLVGSVEYGDGGLGGTRFVVFSEGVAQKLYGKQREVDYISVQADPGTVPERLIATINQDVKIPADAQVKSATQQADDQSQALKDQLGFLTTALLAFGFVAVFVGAFIIFNTFSITVAQRRREFALLRTIGASRRQILSSVLIEAFVIGLLASVAGMLLGLAFALGIQGLFRAIGIDIPANDPELSSQTITVALLVGVLVTLISSLIPAVRATRVAPLEAMRDTGPAQRKRRPVILILALLVTAAGVAMLAYGLLADGISGDGRLVSSAGGAIVLVIGIAVLTPRLIGPIARAVGWPLELSTKLVGRLSRENAQRNPTRTAITSAALMIGLSLVLFVTIFAQGLRVSVNDVIDRTFVGDLLVFNQNGFATIPASVEDTVADTKGVAVASSIKVNEAQLDGATSFANGIDTKTFSDVYKFDWVEGSNRSLQTLGAGDVLVEKGLAEGKKLKLGDSVTITDNDDDKFKLKITGIYNDPAVLNGFTLAKRQWNKIYKQKRIAVVIVKDAPGTKPSQVQKRLERVLTNDYPEAKVRSQSELREENEARINQLLALFYALLGMSIIVSLFGIVNTLTLSIYERTRELGMLRAIGMSRRQVRRMIRYESVITAAIGAVLGLVLGTFLAWIVTLALADDGIVFSFPVGQVIVLMLLALVAGVVAAILPARRASKLDVLEAVGYE